MTNEIINKLNELIDHQKTLIKKAIHTQNFYTELSKACKRVDKFLSDNSSECLRAYTLVSKNITLEYIKNKIWIQPVITPSIEQHEITLNANSFISQHETKLQVSLKNELKGGMFSLQNRHIDFKFKNLPSEVKPVVLILYLMSYLFKFKYEDIQQKNYELEIEDYSTHLTQQYQLKRKHFLNLLLCLNLEKAVKPIQCEINGQNIKIKIDAGVTARTFMALLKDTRQMKSGNYTKLATTLLEILEQYSPEQLTDVFSEYSGILSFRPLSLKAINISEISECLNKTSKNSFHKKFLQNRINRLFSNHNSGLKTINIPFSKRLTDQKNVYTFCYELYLLVNDYKRYDSLETQYAKGKQFKLLRKKAYGIRRDLLTNSSQNAESRVDMIITPLSNEKTWGGKEKQKEKFLNKFKPIVNKFIELIAYEKKLAEFGIPKSEAWVSKRKERIEYAQNKNLLSFNTFTEQLVQLSLKAYTYETEELLIDKILDIVAECSQTYHNQGSPLYFTKEKLTKILGYKKITLVDRDRNNDLSFFKKQMETNPELMAKAIYDNLPIKSVFNLLFSKKKKQKDKKGKEKKRGFGISKDF